MRLASITALASLATTAMALHPSTALRPTLHTAHRVSQLVAQQQAYYQDQESAYGYQQPATYGQQQGYAQDQYGQQAQFDDQHYQQWLQEQQQQYGDPQQYGDGFGQSTMPQGYQPEWDQHKQLFEQYLRSDSYRARSDQIGQEQYAKSFMGWCDRIMPTYNKSGLLEFLIWQDRVAPMLYGKKYRYWWHGE